MAAGTVTLLSPPDTTTGIRLSEPLVFTAALYSGSGSVTEVRLQIATDAGFAAVVYDTQLRTIDAIRVGSIWVEVYPDLIPLSGLTLYYWRVLTRNDAVESSAWSSAFSLTTSAAPVTLAAWESVQ